MCPHNPENRPDHTDSAGDADSNVVPLRRRPGRAGVTVERIETEPMTAEEYRRAVIALAALISEVISVRSGAWGPGRRRSHHKIVLRRGQDPT
ncbi:hypothetical protein GCM10023108_08440 [Saccharopolyspora hordei]